MSADTDQGVGKTSYGNPVRDGRLTSLRLTRTTPPYIERTLRRSGVRP